MIGATKSICKIGERTITDKPSCDGHLPVSEIERKHILQILEPLWFDKTETAGRVRRRIEAVL